MCHPCLYLKNFVQDSKSKRQIIEDSFKGDFTEYVSRIYRSIQFLILRITFQGTNFQLMWIFLGFFEYEIFDNFEKKIPTRHSFLVFENFWKDYQDKTYAF